MGAATFITYGPGNDVDSAFREAVADARHEHGHGGYSGTLAEKHAYTVIAHTPRWLDEAQAYAEKLIDNDDERVRDKWGPAGAVAVCRPHETRIVDLPGASYPGDSDWKTLATEIVGPRVTLARPIRYERLPGGRVGSVQLEVTVRRREAGIVERRKVTVTVEGGRQDHDFADRVEQAVRAKLRLGDDIAVANLNVCDTQPVFAATKTSGTGRSTRWVIVGDRWHDTWATGYATVTEARNRLRELAATPLRQWDSGRVYELQAVTRAADGGPIASIAVAARRTTVTVSVDVVKGRKRPAKTEGWLFFGWASS